MLKGIVTTERREPAPVTDAPDYLKPYLNIDDLQNVQIEVPDVKKITEDFFNSGSSLLIVDGNDVSQEIEDEFNRVYNDLYVRDIRSEEELEEEAQKLLNNNWNNLWKPSQTAGLSQVEADNPAIKAAQAAVDMVSKAQTANTYKNDLKQQWRQADTDEAAQLARGSAVTAVIGNNMNAGKKISNELNARIEDGETQKAIQKALEFMNMVDFEYLTRGALMQCSSGEICRRLNLPQDHGIFYGDTLEPVVNQSDCIIGDEENIASFGLCTGSNHLDEVVTLDSPATFGAEGVRTEAYNRNTCKTGFKCAPLVVYPGWINTYKKTEMGESKKAAVSTKSFLVCLRGGLIYPINSGQHAVQEAKLNDQMMREEFDTLCEAYSSLCTAYDDLKSAKMEKDRSLQGSYMDIFSNKPKERPLEAQLKEVEEAKTAFEKKINDFMGEARADSYGVEFNEISKERKDNLEYMLDKYSAIFETEQVSVRSDYATFSRPYGYNSQSVYNKDPGYFPGSENYIDWRSARMEQKAAAYQDVRHSITGPRKDTKDDMDSEYSAWLSDVRKRGYENLGEWEKEEFDRARNKYYKAVGMAAPSWEEELGERP